MILCAILRYSCWLALGKHAAVSRDVDPEARLDLALLRRRPDALPTIVISHHYIRSGIVLSQYDRLPDYVGERLALLTGSYLVDYGRPAINA